jgi:hypothetical protein
MEDPDIADLLGPSTPKRGPGRPRLPPEIRYERDMDSGLPSMDMTDVFSGVTVGWLSKVFGMDPSDVKKRLADCPPLHRRKAGYVYSLPIAAKYLVKPVFDVQKYLSTMKASELPNGLQKDYWDAALKRQKWEENAGQLWRTEAVLEVLGEAFKGVKFSMQLWADNLERVTGLTEEQRKLLVGMVDGLQDELYDNMVRRAQEKSTPSLRDEMKDVDSAGV